MKLYELFEKNQYKAKSFFDKDDHAVNLVMKRGETVANFIKKNCTAWLSETDNGKGIVWRGYANSGNNQMAFTKKVRKQRRAKDSGKREHEAFQYLIKKCGKVANRENAVFTSSDYGVASDYGNVFATIPIGKFNYTWHSEFDDWHGNVPYEYYLKQKTKDNSDDYSENEYNEIKEKYEKQVEAATQKLISTFDKFGVRVLKTSLARLADDIWDIYSWSNDNDGTMALGTIKKPFPNVMGGTRATVGPMWNRYELKAKPMKDLWMALRKMKPSEKVKVRKAFGQLKAPASQFRAGKRWLRRYKDFNTWQQIQIRKSREMWDDESKKNAFIPGKHHHSKLDKEKLQKFCDGLNGDDGSLMRGIKSGNEIMISCNTVLAVEEDFYRMIVWPLLAGKPIAINNAQAEKLLKGHRDYDGW